MRISFAILAFLVICLVAVAHAQRQSSGGKACTPGETWKESCRTCTCSPKGLPICPRILCPGANGFIKVDLPTIKPAEECVDGETWLEDCNRCWCSGGNKLCTRKRCRPKQTTPRTECTPGTRWQEGCNSCFCSPTGYKGCTYRLCN